MMQESSRWDFILRGIDKFFELVAKWCNTIMHEKYLHSSYQNALIVCFCFEYITRNRVRPQINYKILRSVNIILPVIRL